MNGNNVRNSLDILGEVRKGAAALELSAHIHEAIQAVKMYGKPAKVCIELTISPFKGRGTEHLIEAPVVVTDEITSKLPKPEAEATLFFVDGEGNAVRQPGQRQPGLNLNIGDPSDKKP